MKEELKGPVVKDVYIAAVQETNDLGEVVYNVYLINQKEEELEMTMVTSHGYSSVDDTKTSTLRRLLGNISPKSAEMIEPIIEDVFRLNNEYWLTFWLGDVLYDKKYVFLPETIKKENFVIVPFLDKSGVIIG